MKVAFLPIVRMNDAPAVAEGAGKGHWETRRNRIGAHPDQSQ